MTPLRFIRTAFAWAFGCLATVGCTLPALLISRLPGGDPVAHRMARLWGRLCVWGTGCPVRIEGLAHVDLARRYVVMANHQSALDIPVLMAVLPAAWRTVFWAKESLFRVPVLGWAMRMLGHMPIDRVNRRLAGKMLSDTLRQVEDGRSMLVFPEETYGPPGQLLPFQRGGFVFALRSRLDVLPVAVLGTRDALPPGVRRVAPTRLTVRFGEPIATSELAVGDRPLLAERTRAAIEHLCREGHPGHDLPD
ncbi:MAG TPA: lysophospholipid acyltransferase family protein [Thermoanaerobaculales bacterium]|nr:lysophospholipid acyltransferase family protein [Thermoanaerobaculales bacterium]HPA80935.1 lysophospholipid acyltransferase family protein [Thermoanaerobaculales bacterium]HQN95748.1 lysophospholipid acyltransferase family protein [Thermoanaerobaculales bacterium]HQP44361.1 lysophospholipid acyltransferase family protein [Thermoanaerobaculales bacterium]